MSLNSLAPAHIRYIKLGSGGAWAKEAISNSRILFGYRSVPHSLCQQRRWDEVRAYLSDRRSSGAITAGITELKTFYELDEDCLWITIADGHLWWAFAHSEVISLGDVAEGRPSRFRATTSGWHNTGIHGSALRTSDLSSKLTQVANYRATICEVGHQAYLLRKINGETEPVVAKALQARALMVRIAVEMISDLHWADFETLTDLIFARSGWQRSTRIGGNTADIDILMQQPTTGELAFVQVKSRASQDVLETT